MFVRTKMSLPLLLGAIVRWAYLSKMDTWIYQNVQIDSEPAGRFSEDRKYIFRGDDSFKGGTIGRAFGPEADEADIQDFAEHVLRKETSRNSRYVSFTEEIKIARRFTSAADNQHLVKVTMARLRELETAGQIRIWNPDQVFAALRAGPKKLARRAFDTQTAMKRNSEILIEGLIPADVLAKVN